MNWDRGKLPTFIESFLRSFRVRVGITLSDVFNQEQGVAQGSILSVTLFIIPRLRSIVVRVSARGVGGQGSIPNCVTPTT